MAPTVINQQHAHPRLEGKRKEGNHEGETNGGPTQSLVNTTPASWSPFMMPSIAEGEELDSNGLQGRFSFQELLRGASTGALGHAVPFQSFISSQDYGSYNNGFAGLDAFPSSDLRSISTKHHDVEYCAQDENIQENSEEHEPVSPTESVHLFQPMTVEHCDGNLNDDTEGGTENAQQITAAVYDSTTMINSGTENEVEPVGDSGCNSKDAWQPWPKNKKYPKDLPDCRPPREMGAIEKALRNAPKRKTQHIFEPTPGTTFDSIAEAQEFYNLYSWEVGFGTKKGDKHKNSMQEFHCQCKGSDTRVQYKTKKQKCPAMIRLHRTEDLGWYVSLHRSEHNHPLSETCGEKLSWNSHGRIDQYTKDMIRYLRENNVTITKVNNILGSMFGPNGEAPCTRRYLRTLCAQIARDQRNDDVKKTMEVFLQLKKQDPGFQFDVDYDEENRIKTLLWCTGRSRSQYACFGDVVTFDTTYCTNIYKMPFGLFVGVNNHFQSTIFAGVLMCDEKTISFEWVFKQFIVLMGGRQPVTILTDQCQAMNAALKTAMKGTAHLWCKWHVMRTAQEELGPMYNVGTPFHDEFNKIINEMLTEDEFERAWDEMLDRYKLRENDFMKRTYNKRHKWAKAFNKGTYCAGMTSTQRSESANHMMKKHVPRNSSMNRFVMNYNNMLLARYRDEEIAEHETKTNVYVSERLWPIEMHAMEVYTSAIFKLFRKQVDKATRYNVLDTSDPSVFIIEHDKAKERERWARVTFTVRVEDGGGHFDCDCGMYDHMGIVCCHVIRVMFRLGVSKIPDRHIMIRWTRHAKDALPDHLNFYQKETVPMQTMTYRHRLLRVNATELVKEGDDDSETFDIAARHIKVALQEIAEYKKAKAAAIASESQTERDTSCSEGGNGTDTDGEPCGNMYGAAGSSAGLSDTELLSMRPPAIRRKAGRPRVTRYMPRMDVIGKKMKKKSKVSVGRKKASKVSVGRKKKGTTRCTTCDLYGHLASECMSLSVDVNTLIP